MIVFCTVSWGAQYRHHVHLVHHQMAQIFLMISNIWLKKSKLNQNYHKEANMTHIIWVIYQYVIIWLRNTSIIWLEWVISIMSKSKSRFGWSLDRLSTDWTKSKIASEKRFYNWENSRIWRSRKRFRWTFKECDNVIISLRPYVIVSISLLHNRYVITNT